jgi:intein/homing endonuclease
VNNDIEKRFVSEYIDGNSSQTIANKYGFKTRKTVLDVLEKNMIKRRPPKKQTYYREDFFEKMDSPEKAYILGLIMTDGYIIKDYSGFGIQLTKSDGYLLKKIALIIGARQGVSQIVCNAKRKSTPNTKDMVRLSVHNRRLAEDLKKLGVTRNKSKTLRYAGSVPKKYLSHFFRGLIDGDGTIGVAKNNNIWCQLSSASSAFIGDLLGLALSFTLRLNTSITKYRSGKEKIIKECKMYTARVSGGNQETIRFLRWLYDDKRDLYLRRKYAKVQNQIS